MIAFLLVLFSLLLNSVQCDEKSKILFKECGETIVQNQFILESVGYPNGYPPNISCEYTFKGHSMCQTEFHIQFLDFDLEESSNCFKDYLEIIDNEKLCGSISGVQMYKTRNYNLQLKFTSDELVHGRGFKLLITKLPCAGNNHLNSNQGRTSLKIDAKINLPKCCADFYNSRRFYLASPGFPYSNQIPSDCQYHVYRANPNICRLRIHFKYFSNGLPHGDYCENGFLEIDGKQICGCRTGLDVISQFDQFWGNNPKIIRYKNNGYSRNYFNGFVMEVTQDECPKRYSPSLETNSNATKGEKLPEFYFYNDQLNRISWPNKTQANTENENIDDNNMKPKVTIDYYFFKPPENDESIPEFKSKESRSYFETTSTDFLSPEGHDESKCDAWGFVQWTLLTKEILWKKMPQCKITQQLDEKCYDIRKNKAYLLNPGYPFFYYSNLNCCYRFHRNEGYCGINFFVIDFNLESSPDCKKDALVLYNKYKYCGNDLYNTKFKFDLQHQQYEEIKFLTDNYYCGRGFKIFYEQTPCENTTPYVPPITITPPPPTPTQPLCGGEITSEYFDINFANSHEECTHHIHRVDQDVCGLQLLLLNFDLICGTEYLLINTKRFCGKMNGQSTFATFDPRDTVTISYQRRVGQPPTLSNIVIRGRQLRGKECDPFILDVPAQRILNMK